MNRKCAFSQFISFKLNQANLSFIITVVCEQHYIIFIVVLKQQNKLTIVLNKQQYIVHLHLKNNDYGRVN